jgi:hypothetical protein
VAVLGEPHGAVVGGDDRPDVSGGLGTQVEVVTVAGEWPREFVIPPGPLGPEPLGAKVVIGGIIAETNSRHPIDEVGDVVGLGSAGAAEVTDRVVAGTTHPRVRGSGREIAGVAGTAGTRAVARRPETSRARAAAPSVARPIVTTSARSPASAIQSDASSIRSSSLPSITAMLGAS